MLGKCADKICSEPFCVMLGTGIIYFVCMIKVQNKKKCGSSSSLYAEHAVLLKNPGTGGKLEFQPALLSEGLEKCAGWWGGSILYEVYGNDTWDERRTRS